jgi:hypothetical protein
MKTQMTQAWGWLTAAVLAAGLNASYHDGGLQWAHQVADRVEHGSAAVLALTSGRADQFLTEARSLTARDETASCPWATMRDRVQSRIDRSMIDQSKIDRSQAGWDLMSAREQAQLARLEANRARMEARIAAQTAHIRIAMADFDPVDLRAIPAPVVCPRIRVNVPRLPMIKAPVIHVGTTSAGPV